VGKREYLYKLIEELVKMPSITESEQESAPALWLHDRLSKLRYFRETLAHLQLIETPLEGAAQKLFAVLARVDAAKPTSRTVLLISHFDVVDIKSYGDLAEFAFNPSELQKRLGTAENANDVMWGRGTMDMKCGVALELDIIEEFADNRGLFDVNVVAAFVGDEENASAGMRGVLPALAELQKEGLEFLAAVNTEPGEAGQTGQAGPMIFTGTLGKLLPSFYVKGRPAHVGNCYYGYSAALAASHIVSDAEGASWLADPLHGISQPSWICLDMRVLKDGYSVTVPDRAYAYFNCFTTTHTPAKVMEQMQNIARRALEKTTLQMDESYRLLSKNGYRGGEFVKPPVRVLTLEQLTAMARVKFQGDFDASIDSYIETLPLGDVRARGIALVDKIADMAGEDGPYVVCFFLPPWLPVRTDVTDDPKDRGVMEAVQQIKKAAQEGFGIEMREIELFAGLCDLSYVGAKVSARDLKALEQNMPGFGAIYNLPLDEMQQLGMPVLNIGPSGEDAHKRTERLNLHYSLEILPQILRTSIGTLSKYVP